MQGKYDINPVYELAGILNFELRRYKEFEDDLPIERGYDELDNVLKLILLNNGCRIASDKIQYQLIKNIIPNEYQICFITGMIGNEVNDYYDFLILNGMKILVIFIEYFDGLITHFINENDPMYQLKIAMGNSVYYDAIKKIVEIFYLTSEPMPGGLLTTAMTTTQRWNQAIIAINIINFFKPIDENDVSDIPMEDIKKILDGNIELQLYGIRTM